ncbi:low-density lipoprotein receptor-related protein 2-like isoform X2 [Branchiostoma floridae x Branchiostoma belcheri]
MESLGLRIFVLHLLCAGSLGSRDDGEPFLLVADNILDSIFQVNATSGSRFQLPLGGPRFPISVDYDPTTDFVYWSDRLDRHIKRARRDGSGMETIVTNDVYAAYGLALDHAGGNVYWTDSTASTVSVARMDGTFARSLLTSPAVDRPGGLVLDPRNGYMYWTDWGIDARIDRAAMDGSNQTTIISNLTDPNMITIDYKENRLYYSDGYAYSIYSSDLLGNDIRRLFYEDGNYLFGIGIDDDNIYWTSWTNDQILMLPRSNLEQNETVLVDGLGTPNDIYVSGESLVDVTNGCSQSNGGCQDLCLARPGGRTCACRALWELHQDGMNCLPPDLVSPSYLWLDHSYRTGVTSVKMTPGNGSVIRELDEEGRNLPVTVLFSSAAPSRIEAIDYDFQRNLIFWVDTGLREIHTVDIHDSKIQSFTTLFEGISSGVEGLAVDWLNQNLYYTDPYFNWIGVVSYKYIPARHHVIVHEGLSRPRGIAVHPLRGYLFWSERSTSTIERSALSGQQRNKIVIVDIQFPSGLVINGDRLFWADTFRDRIESCDLNGDNREVFFTYFGTHFYDITTDGVSIAATDWADDSINFLYGGETSGSFLHYGDGTVYGVEYFDQSRQPPGQTECQVDNGGCNHTCVGDPDGHRCLCLLNFHLAEDNHTCIANEHQFSKAVFVGSDSGILQLPHNFLDLPEAGDWTDSYIVRGTKAFAMDFDYAGKMLFYTQQQNDGTQTIERFLFIGEGSSMTVFQNGQGIEGIAVDWVASNLYWTERQLGRIHVSKLDGSLRKVLMSGLDQPSAIAVHPEQSYVFWTEVGANPKISRASPDGSNKMVLVSSQTNDLTGSPTALAIDYNEERLYWVTTNPGSVESCNFDGWYVRTLRSADNADLFGVAFYKDYALWTDNSNQTLTFGRAYSGETHHDSRTVALSTAAYNIKVYDDTEQMLHTSACDQRNGGCMELCLPLENSRVCACGEGRYLQADAVSCSHVRPANIPTTPPPTVRSSGEDFLLVADYDTGYISEVNVTSGSNVTLPLHSTSPLALDYDSRTGYVYWSDYYDEIIYRAKRDGSGFETLVDNTQVSVSAINGLALDYAGQNIYWTDYWTEIIGVAKMDGRHAQAIVSENLNWPGDIVLDPTEGYMYWTDESFWTPRIERAAMDGSDRTVIVDTDLDSPVGITIDLIERRLYWCDSWLYNIQSSDLDGNNRQTLLSRSYGRFYGLSLNAHELFWTSSSDSYIGANSKSEYDQTTSRVVADGFSSLRGIAMYSPDVATDVSNACSVSNGGCQDVCLARPGGRTCACRAYFHLQSDNATCAPPEIKSPSFLWINEVDGKTLLTALEANSSIVRSPDFQSLPLTTVMAARPPSIIVSLDYDIRQGLIFWIDIGMKEIQQVDVRTGMVTTLLTAISAGAEALATDWINQNLYYTDFNYNRITMVSYGLGSSSGNSHIIAETGLDKPRGIAVDPSAGYVFWSDWGQSPKIERSTLSGEDRTAIVESDLGRPSGLVIDHATSKLYFADTERDTIDSCDFDGNNRQQFYSLPGTHFYDITFDGEEILASDWSDTTINFIHDSRPLTFVRPRGQNIMAVEFFHESRQPQSQSDCQVNNGGCQHTCVGDQSGHKCLCLADYSLAQDQQTCVKNDHLFTKALLVSTDEGILQFPHNLADLPGTADSKPTALVRGGKTVAMDFNYNEKAIYYTKEMDDGTQTIQKYDLTTNSSLTIYTGGQGIEGLAVDWVAANIYWTERNSGTISVARLDGSFRKVLLSGLVQPRGVAVHPEQRLLYWTETGRIVRSTLAGTDKEVIVSSQSDESIQNPAGISFDLLNSWVYWADSGAGTVMASDLRGEDPELRWTSNGGELFGIAVYKDFNFWTDRTNQTVSIGLRRSLEKVVQLQTTPHSVRVFDGSEQPLSRGPCDMRNGDCNELCLPTTADDKVCACTEGHLMQADNLTCYNPAATVAVTTPAVQTTPVTPSKPATTTTRQTTPVTPSKPVRTPVVQTTPPIPPVSTTNMQTTTTRTTFKPAMACTPETLPSVTDGDFGQCVVTANVKTCNVVCKPSYGPTVSSIKCLPSGNWDTGKDYTCTRLATPEAVSVNVSFSFSTVPCTTSTMNSLRASLIDNFQSNGICQTAVQNNIRLCEDPNQMTVSCSFSSGRKRRASDTEGKTDVQRSVQEENRLLKKREITSYLAHEKALKKQAKEEMAILKDANREKRNTEVLQVKKRGNNDEDALLQLVKKAGGRIMVNRVKRQTTYGVDVDIAVKAIPDTSDGSLEDSISKTQQNLQNVVDDIETEVAAGNVAVEVDGQTYRADRDSFTAMAVKYECPSGTVEIDGGCGQAPSRGGSNGAAVAVGVVVTLLLLGAMSLGGYMYCRQQRRKFGPGRDVRLSDLTARDNPVYDASDIPPAYTAYMGEGLNATGGVPTKDVPGGAMEAGALPEKAPPAQWVTFDDAGNAFQPAAEPNVYQNMPPSAPQNTFQSTAAAEEQHVYEHIPPSAPPVEYNMSVNNPSKGLGAETNA